MIVLYYRCDKILSYIDVVINDIKYRQHKVGTPLNSTLFYGGYFYLSGTFEFQPLPIVD